MSTKLRQIIEIIVDRKLNEVETTKKFDIKLIKRLMRELYNEESMLRSFDPKTEKIKKLERKLISLGVMHEDGSYVEDLPDELEKYLQKII